MATKFCAIPTIIVGAFHSDATLIALHAHLSAFNPSMHAKRFRTSKCSFSNSSIKRKSPKANRDLRKILVSSQKYEYTSQIIKNIIGI